MNQVADNPDVQVERKKGTVAKTMHGFTVLLC